MRTVVGYHRYDTAAELLLLKIWKLQSNITNFFLPQQKLITKVRDGAKITNKNDVPTIPHRRAERHVAVSPEDKAIMNDALSELNAAAIQRQIQVLTAELLTLTRNKNAATPKPGDLAPTPRASAHESTTPATRAS